MSEKMYPIKGYEGKYSITKSGKVYSHFHKTKPPRLLKISYDLGGYCRVGLFFMKKQKNCTVHRLVATTFIPNKDKLKQVNHIDGNKKNNCVCNLEWITHKKNIQHASANGLLRSGKRLTVHQALGIRADYNSGEHTWGEIKEKYGVGLSTVARTIKKVPAIVERNRKKQVEKYLKKARYFDNILYLRSLDYGDRWKRDVEVYILRNGCKMTLASIGKKYNLSTAGVSYIAKILKPRVPLNASIHTGIPKDAPPNGIM